MDDAPHGPTFEDLLASPHLQFDLDNELLPHLIAFGPPKPRRPWLFDAATSTTATANSGTSATGGDQIPALLAPGFILSARRMRRREGETG